MSNKELHDYIGNSGWETVMRRVEPSEIEDENVRRIFAEAQRCFDNWDALCNAMYQSLQPA